MSASALSLAALASLILIQAWEFGSSAVQPLDTGADLALLKISAALWAPDVKPKDPYGKVKVLRIFLSCIKFLALVNKFTAGSTPH